MTVHSSLAICLRYFHMKLNSYKDAQYLFNDYSPINSVVGSVNLPSRWFMNTIQYFIKGKSCKQSSEETLFMSGAREGIESQLASFKILKESNFRG